MIIWRAIHSVQQGLQILEWTSFASSPPKGGAASPSRSCPHFTQWTIAISFDPSTRQSGDSVLLSEPRTRFSISTLFHSDPRNKQSFTLFEPTKPKIRGNCKKAD